MYMYVCTRTCMYICTDVCMYVRTYVRTYVCTCMYVVCMYVLYVCMYICMYMYVHVYIHNVYTSLQLLCILVTSQHLTSIPTTEYSLVRSAYGERRAGPGPSSRATAMN